MKILLEKRIDEGPYSRQVAFATAREWALASDMTDPGAPPSLEEE
jgi:hypothetical protein